MDSSKTNVFEINPTKISNIVILDTYTPLEFSNLLYNLENNIIEPIQLTLPCGMRNGSDNIDQLQSVCGSNTFKSNEYKINIKNINIQDLKILDGLVDNLDYLNNVTPVTSNLDSVEFNNYK